MEIAPNLCPYNIREYRYTRIMFVQQIYGFVVDCTVIIHLANMFAHNTARVGSDYVSGKRMRFKVAIKRGKICFHQTLGG